MGEEDNAEISADGKTLFMNWSEGPVPRSSYDSVWLRTLADIAGDQVRASIPGDADVSTVSDSAWFDWLEYPVRGRPAEECHLQVAESFQVGHFEHATLAENREAFMKTL